MKVKPTRQEKRSFCMGTHYERLLHGENVRSKGSLWAEVLKRRTKQYRDEALNAILMRAREPWWRRWWSR